VNILICGRPYLAAVVESNDGEYLTYFHPYLRVKKSFIIPHHYVQPFQPQVVDGHVELLKVIKNKKKIKAAKKLVKSYELALYQFLESKK